MHKRFTLAPEIRALGDDEVEVVMSTAMMARDGHVLVPTGCRLANYRANPIVLWQHDAGEPVGRCEEISTTTAGVVGRVRFAPAGISATADMVRGLVKSGILGAVSVGFDPLKGEPLNPAKPRSGQRFTDWELLELSFVSVPADTGAIVTARALEAVDLARRHRAIAALALGEPVDSDLARRRRAVAALRLG